MGLSGVKKRSKLSQDPNNTTWAKSTENFGHKMLSKQGWKPGDFLGAENANHSEHYTAANASHIRVMLREDNLGIGAKVGKGNAETFGLSMFSGLLGRLNGKSDGEVQKQQSALRDAELRAYAGQKHGYMNFVSGGLLIGDKMELKSTPKDKIQDSGVEKKRKRDASEAQVDTSEEARVPQAKRSKNSKGSQSASKLEKKSSKAALATAQDQAPAHDTDSPSDDSSDADSQRDNKAKERKKERRKSGKETKSATAKEEKSRLKAEKRARKEERRKRKEEKRRKREAKVAADAQQTSAAASESEGTATPPIQQAFTGRQALRQRYIQQKRMASMDPQALKEIFMLQAKATA